MVSTLYIIFGLILLGIMISVIWRLVSNRQELPCPSWLGRMVELDNPFTRVNRAEVIIEHLALTPGMKVLDAGCGPGRLTLSLAKAVGPHGEVTAMDVQAEMLARVREKVQAARLQNVRFLEAGLGERKLQEDYYDRALLVTVLGEIPDQEAALAEIFRALKPGGILSVTEIIFDPHFQRAETVLRIAEATGFRKVNSFGKRLTYTMHLEKSAGSIA